MVLMNWMDQGLFYFFSWIEGMIPLIDIGSEG